MKFKLITDDIHLSIVQLTTFSDNSPRQIILIFGQTSGEYNIFTKQPKFLLINRGVHIKLAYNRLQGSSGFYPIGEVIPVISNSTFKNALVNIIIPKFLLITKKNIKL